MIGAQAIADRRAATLADVRADQMARAQLSLLDSELQKFRILPVVLAEYQEVRALLAQTTPEMVDAVNRKLLLVAGRTDTAVIYVLEPHGRVLAASNWNTPASFVGMTYRFRPYFQDALRQGSAEMFALGTVSGRPGLYIAQRIGSAARPMGVIVIKVEFDKLEATWAHQPGITIVTDEHGIVIITSRPGWRFHGLRPIDAAARDQVRRSIQFGALPLTPIGLRETAEAVRTPDGRLYRTAALATPLAGARLRFFQPLEPLRASTNASARIAVLVAAVLLTGVLLWMLRGRERDMMREASRRELQEEVTRRTAELHDANRLLQSEAAAREVLNDRFRKAREELTQANRLGTLGQVTAGVAHEINQPVAAIRSFAENAKLFLRRADVAKTGANLDLIVGLTERIGAITSELRAFARRGTPAQGAVDLDNAIDGALLLVGDRLRQAGVAVRRGHRAEGARVVADAIRLEQILVNLLQNAADACEGRAGAVVEIDVGPGTAGYRLTIGDNGRGVPDAIRDSLFEPFVTSRDGGLGLGLGIARDIAREFGGELDLAESGLSGTIFTLDLRRA